MGKAQRTRERLQQVALDLFGQQGYEQTTVADIAATAGVTPMTFFRHFPSKESVIMDDPYDPMIARRVAEQDQSLPALERVRRGLAAAWADMSDVEDELAQVRLRVVARETSLRSKVRENNARTEDAIVAALSEQGMPRFVAAVASGAALGALTAALFAWAERDGADSLGQYIRGALDVLGAQDPLALP